MLTMAPYVKRLDIYTYKLPDLKSRISDRIYITRDLLDNILPSPIQIQHLPQELAYEGYIRRSRELIQEANLDILDIQANYREDIPPKEIDDFKTYLHNIEHETSAVCNDLRTWKNYLARHPAGATQDTTPHHARPTLQSPETPWPPLAA